MFLLGQTVALYPEVKDEKEVQIDTMVMEKNITFPTDAKLAKKVIDNCATIAQTEGITQRQSYKRVAKQSVRDAYFGHHPKRKKKVLAAEKKLRTIGKRVVREQVLVCGGGRYYYHHNHRNRTPYQSTLQINLTGSDV